jgi:hypothetical protein
MRCLEKSDFQVFGFKYVTQTTPTAPRTVKTDPKIMNSQTAVLSLKFPSLTGLFPFQSQAEVAETPSYRRSQISPNASSQVHAMGEPDR